MSCSLGMELGTQGLDVGLESGLKTRATVEQVRVGSVLSISGEFQSCHLNWLSSTEEQVMGTDTHKAPGLRVTDYEHSDLCETFLSEATWPNLCDPVMSQPLNSFSSTTTGLSAERPLTVQWPGMLQRPECKAVPLGASGV